MELTEITLPARDVTAVSRFYGETLGLPVQQDGRRAVVTVGASTLAFVAGPPQPGVHHLAFTVPTGGLPAGKEWLTGRAPLLGRDGQDEFDTAPSWNARSVYFDGPEGSVLELIARHDLDNARPGPFTSRDLLCVSEVGVAVPDVRGVAARLADEAGIEAYGDEPGETFAAVGDVHGLLILVTPGRSWFPTADRRVAAVPTSVQVRGGRPGRLPLGAGSSVQVLG